MSCAPLFVEELCILAMARPVARNVAAGLVGGLGGGGGGGVSVSAGMKGTVPERCSGKARTWVFNAVV